LILVGIGKEFSPLGFASGIKTYPCIRGLERKRFGVVNWND
jgi:hypothetical protein